MDTATRKNADRSFPRYQWVLEVLIFAIVTPALVFGVLSIGNLPLIA